MNASQQSTIEALSGCMAGTDGMNEICSREIPFSIGWTYGVLANLLWSVAGEGSRADVNATFLQPFVSYTTKTITTFGLNTEFTYDWANSS